MVAVAFLYSTEDRVISSCDASPVEGEMLKKEYVPRPPSVPVTGLYPLLLDMEPERRKVAFLVSVAAPLSLNRSEVRRSSPLKLWKNCCINYHSQSSEVGVERISGIGVISSSRSA